MNLVSDAFLYPFRRGAGPAWAVGLPLVLLMPVGLVPLLGYLVAAVRASHADPTAPPPPWRPLDRILGEGLMVGLLLLLVTVPFLFAGWWLQPLLAGYFARVADPLARAVLPLLAAAAVTGFFWGCAVLVLLPPAIARYAISGSPGELFDLRRPLRTVRRGFARWNLVATAIVSAWALGLAAIGLLCLGVIPGVFYAWLATAHATAALADG